jgi:Subtilase family
MNDSQNHTSRRRTLALLGIGFVAVLVQLATERTQATDSSRVPQVEKRGAPGHPSAGFGHQAETALAHRGDANELSPSARIYLPGQVMVSLERGADLAAVAHDHGATVLRPPGPAGYAVLDMSGEDEGGRTVDLLADPRIARAAPNGRVFGAGEGEEDDEDEEDEEDEGGSSSSRQGLAYGFQWHLGAADALSTPSSRNKDMRVAILDSGVAYTSCTHDGVLYKQAASLAEVAFKDPYDFVDGDNHPHDEHMHGTHIASLIASDGEVEGLAPDVAIIPIRVLDESNAGTEAELLDGLAWAIKKGADVINLSLSFSDGYVPSYALRALLQEASDKKIVLVAAAGNSGSETVSWPAASPIVLAVGASQLESAEGGLITASYSNIGTGLFIRAPGGNLNTDYNSDGYGDGILAETIDLNDPTTTNYWFLAGSSQATAIVSGSIAALMAEKAEGKYIRRLLQAGAWGGESPSSAFDLTDGEGVGELDLGVSRAAWDAALAAKSQSAYEESNYYVGILPYLAAMDGSMVPKADVVVVNAKKKHAAGVEVVGTLTDSDGNVQRLSCETDSAGQCTLSGEATKGDGDSVAAAWQVTIDAVFDGYVGPPGTIVFQSDGVDSIIKGLDKAGAGDKLIAFAWGEETDDDLGDLAASYSMVDTGSGLASLPIGLILTRLAMEGSAEMSSVTVTVGKDKGTFTVLDLEGTGLASLPIGFRSVSIVALGGTGLASLPIGFKPRDMQVGADVGLVVAPDGMWNGGGELKKKMEAGGWTSDGYGAASAVVGSGAIAIGSDFAEEFDACDVGDGEAL